MEYKYNTLKVEIEDSIALVKFNRPEALNAANEEMSYERLELFKKLQDDRNVKVVIITGSEKAYCAGGDLATFSKYDTDEALVFGNRGYEYQLALMNLSKPVISGISGYAFGGGFENVLLCDIRIATKSAKFALPEINVGIFPGGGATQRLVQNISICKAKEMIFLGETISAQEALELNLINKVVDTYEEMLEECFKTAKKLCKKPTLSLAAAKYCINRAWGRSTAEGTLMEMREWANIYSTEDQKEGMEAFLEKRKPEYKDR